MAVDVEISEHIATITMNRPEALNAFDNGQLRAMTAAFRGIGGDRDVRAVILTGAGLKAFAAGADIKEMAEMTAAEGLAFARLGHAMALAIENLAKPVIAAVNGYALGGGSEAALACDLRIASENAVFAQPEVSLGIPPGWGATQRLTRLVGPGLSAEIIFSGRRVKADEALRIGLVNAVHPADRLMAEARSLAAVIAKNSPQALALAKQALQLAFNGANSSGLDTEARSFGGSFGTDDQREGMRAFIEKRAPDFLD